MGYLDSVQQSYIAWAWGPYNCKQDPALISDWAGTPTRSYGQGFHDHLAQLAARERAAAAPSVVATADDAARHAPATGSAHGAIRGAATAESLAVVVRSVSWLQQVLHVRLKEAGP
jgi:hypothetical protein